MNKWILYIAVLALFGCKSDGEQSNIEKFKGNWVHTSYKGSMGFFIQNDSILLASYEPSGDVDEYKYWWKGEDTLLMYWDKARELVYRFKVEKFDNDTLKMREYHQDSHFTFFKFEVDSNKLKQMQQE